MLGLTDTVIEDVELVEEALGWADAEVSVIVHVRPRHGHRLRCPHCRRRCGKYDDGRGRRRWRALDLGSIRAHVEADAARVRCGEHGVVNCPRSGYAGMKYLPTGRYTDGAGGERYELVREVWD